MCIESFADEQKIVEVEKATRKLSLLEHEADHPKDTVMQPIDEKRIEEAESAKEGHIIGQQSQHNLVPTEKGSSEYSENLRAHEKERESGCLAQDPDFMQAIKSRLFKPDMTIDRFNHEPKSYSAPATLKNTLNKKRKTKKGSKPGEDWRSTSY